MTLSKHQLKLLDVIKQLIERSLEDEIIYKSEWLGYLPYGVYEWIEVNGKDITTSINAETLRQDLQVLEDEKLIAQLKKDTSTLEDDDVHIYYKILDH